MPRRNQEAEDEAYAKALQDEYRKEYTRQQAERSRRENAIGAGEASAGIDGDHFETETASSGNRKKKSKGDKKKTKSSKSRSKSRSKNKSNPRSRSSSRDSTGSATGRDKRRRRRRRNKSDEADSSSGDEWLPTHYPDQQQQEQSMGLVDYNVFPLPPPPFVDDQGVPPTWGNQTSGDEEYARRIQQEIADAEYAQRLSEREKQPENSGVFNAPTPIQHNRGVFKDNSSSGSTGPLTDDDEVVARRIQQELADAEYAARINNLEREEAASRGIILSIERQNQLNMVQQQQQQRRPRSCLATWIPMILCIAVAITIPLLYVFDIFNPAELLGDLFKDDWLGGDLGNITFDDINGTRVPQLPSNAIGWANTGSGLRLDILNACSDDYQEFVQEALDNWDNGSPIDSLTLFTSRIDHEIECNKVMGKLKICNGDYGNKGWRGINEVTLAGLGQRTIINSIAKLNQFYLDFESDAQKLYTSCHELGHGFGLPHWDEDFYNKDLGNCMDYTQNPHKSSKPDESNFYYLAQLYGGRDVNTNEELSAADAAVLARANNEAIDQSVPEEESQGNLNNGLNLGAGGGTRFLRDGRFSGIPLSKSRVVPHDDVPTPRRRILHASETSEIHVFESLENPEHIVVQQYLLA